MLTLSCANCGAGLKIDQAHSIIQCAYCGSAQKIEQNGDSLLLRTIDSKLGAIGNYSARAAAELALPRLKQELAEAQYQRQSLIEKYQNTLKKREEHDIAKIILPPLIGLLVGFAAAYIIGLSALDFPCVAVGLGYGIYRSIRAYKSTRWSPAPTPSLVTDLDMRITEIESTIAQQRALLASSTPANQP